MKKNLFLLLPAFLFVACTPSMNQAVSDALNTLKNSAETPLTNDQVAGGLKDALVQGISKGADLVSVKDGYFKNPSIKILFPPEAQKVETRLRDIGMGSMVDNLTEKLNRAAEDAALQAKPIFTKAITSMTISDAMNILMGEQNAATNYLRKTTSNELYTTFKPVVTNSLEKVQALKYWTDVINTYNKIPLVEKMNPDLHDYVTNKAMDGLFLMIENEEKQIRKDPIARTTELMKKVFAKQDKK